MDGLQSQLQQQRHRGDALLRPALQDHAERSVDEALHASIILLHSAPDVHAIQEDGDPLHLQDADTKGGGDGGVHQQVLDLVEDGGGGEDASLDHAGAIEVVSDHHAQVLVLLHHGNTISLQHPLPLVDLLLQGDPFLLADARLGGALLLRLLRRGVLQHGVDAWNHHHTALGRSDGHAPRVRPLCHLVHPSLQLLRTPPHDTQVIREEEVGAGRFPGLSFSELGKDVVDEEGEEDGAEGAALPQSTLQRNGLGGVAVGVDDNGGVGVELLDEGVDLPADAHRAHLVEQRLVRDRVVCLLEVHEAHPRVLSLVEPLPTRSRQVALDAVDRLQQGGHVSRALQCTAFRDGSRPARA